MRKSIPRKKSINKKSIFDSKLFWSILIFALILGLGYYKRNALAYYFGFKSDKILKEEKKYSSRNAAVLAENYDKVAGIDVSQYQGKIDWDEIKFINKKYPIGFVFIRASVGNDCNDSSFKCNWKEAKKHKIIRGAYHYYRPNENSVEQAERFIQLVKLEKGDLPPVLDIEKLPVEQSIDSLKIGLKRFLKKIDEHYKIKPIIYTSQKYYEDFLEEEFEDYTFWIANYNFIDEKINDDFLFWQFTEKGKVNGIKYNVDLNIYNGTPKMLDYLRID
jgi:lysozyme